MSSRALHSIPVRSLLAFALAIALALGQHAAAVHELGHAAEHVHHDGSAPWEQECPDHELYAAFAGTIPGTASASLPDAATGPAPPAGASERIHLPPRYSFHSRAPPATLAAG